jgi:cell division protein FtsW
MARKLKSDRVLFLTTVALLAASIVMVYSASPVLAADQYRQSTLFLTKQVLFAILGLAAMAIAMQIDYQVYRHQRFIWAVVGCTVVALVAVLFVGPRINGARRWFALGGIGIQPAELAKLAMILFTAAVLERRMDRITDVKYALGPIAIVLAVMLGLIAKQPDFGSAMIVLACVAGMVFAAGLPYRYFIGIGLGLVPLIALYAVSADYRLRRLAAYWNPWEQPQGDGFHAVQSMIAVGTGGLTGRGLGNSLSKLYYLPEAHTDFIYAVVSEEIGLIGSSLVLLAFCVITWRGLRIVARTTDAFGAFLATGLTAMFAVQALFNISVVLGLLPVKGIPLPFVSAGGSSLIVSLAGMGVLLNISQRASAKTT